MDSTDISTTRLVADIGGTNSRLGLFDPGANELRAVKRYTNRDHTKLEDILALWLQSLEEPAPTACCLAVAAPPAGDKVEMLNIDWSFSCREVAQRFGFDWFSCINDFVGNAYSLPHLATADLIALHTGKVSHGAKLATVGPGTGLGGATLDQAITLASACEPGYMGLAPATPLELEIFRALQPKYGEIYAELLVSGPGLLRLYQTLAQVRGEAAQALTQEDISSRAIAGTCELCTATLDTFCALLGSVCGDFVLGNGAYGGLYLAGGILTNMVPFLQASNFEQRFQSKGLMREHLKAVPLFVITSQTAGLIGAAYAPLQRAEKPHP